MMIIRKAFRLSAGRKASSASPQGAAGLLLTFLWFGLLVGWLELGLIVAQRAVNPHIPIDALRANRHFVWMILVSDVLIFSAVGLLIAVLGRFRPQLAIRTALRLPVGLSFLALLLAVEGLHVAASVILACGLAVKIGPWLGCRVVSFDRLVRVSAPAMALSLIVLTGMTYERITSAEHRTLSRRPPAKPGAPNVLLIVLDTVRAANLSLYGHTRPTTPNLERLVRTRNAVVFAEARSPAPWTLPSHACMMTGHWPHELSVGPDLPLDGTFPTLAEVLAKEGYATAGFVGNTRYCNARFGLDRGFARYEDYYENQTVSLFETVRCTGLGRRIVQLLGYPIRAADGPTSVRKTAAMLNRDVLGWLAERPASQPFFLFINYFDVHRPYVLNEENEPCFGMAALPIARRAEIDKRFLDLDAGRIDPDDQGRQQIVDEAFGLYRDSYDSCIADLDRQVGLLLDELDRRGSLENTLVIVTSDHGEHLGEHGLLGHSLSLYRPEVHVPLLVIPPSQSSAARIVNEPVSLREIPATIAEWVDLGPRNPFPGRSLARFLVDGTERQPEASPVLCEVERMEEFSGLHHIPSSHGSISSLVSRDRVYIRGEGASEELFDLRNDPFESINLAASPQSRPVIQRFREELSRLCRGVTTLAR